MQRLWKRYREHGLVIVAVAADKGDAEQVASFVEKPDVDYPSLGTRRTRTAIATKSWSCL